VLEIAGNLMAKNDALASRLRERFAKSRTLVVNVLSSPGSGKTTLLVHTLSRFTPRYKTAALVGDQATDNDAQRLARSGARVQQITTAAECRLDADMILKAMSQWEEDELDLLVIENVGNLICPAEYDLGEDLRVVLFSVTEGEDKPLKYPLAFNTAHVVVLTKLDIADAVEFHRDTAMASIQSVNPDAPILELSARTGDGLHRWFALLDERIAEKQRRDRPEHLSTITP
jgi:hydrogenase nickel incorporation protein HypB